MGWTLLFGSVVLATVEGAKYQGPSAASPSVKWAVALLACGLLGALMAMEKTADVIGALLRWCWSIASWAWKGRRWWAKDAAGDGTVVRRALYTTWSGALGATLGWAVWIVGDVTLAHPRDLAVSAVVGGVLGLGLAGVERYRTARRLDASEEAAPVSAPVPKKIIMAALVSVFLRAALEETSTNLVQAVYRSFFVSLLIYMPAALLFGMAVNKELDESKSSNAMSFWWPILYTGGLVGIPLGASIGCIVFLLNALIGERIGLGAVCGWWVMICISATLVSLYRRSKGGLRLAGATLVFAFGVAVYGASSATEVYARQDSPNGAWIDDTAAFFGNAMVTAPDVPSRTWEEAEAQLRTSGIMVGYDPGLPSSLTGTFSRLIQCDHIPSIASESTPQSYLDRKRAFCVDLHDGWRSGLARSWVVLAGFLAGVGSAAGLDRRSIPTDYADSQTRRYDRYGAVATILLVIIGVVVLRFA